ncbi:response regulator [Limisalsivibrio acetivorans]|uniref:response regulator n=1 Tax=Limisalsivibrio acetivorans TaxID=1304888 RepID=UPI0003B6D4C6|nr:response regulator [Limisalsivibrio acetivorans]
MGAELSTLKVLYVEDESVTRMAVTRVLQKRVAEVFSAKDGKEGLDLYTQHKPDVVLTDLQMPVMDGWEMIAEIRKENGNVPIIVISAYDYEDSQYKVCDSIVKPVIKDVLFEKIERCAK